MNALTNIWKNYTLEFSPIQKAIIAVVLAVIFLTAISALVLVALELTK